MYKNKISTLATLIKNTRPLSHKEEYECDIEHAYYSSALSGCTLDRKDIERFCKQVVY